jgi:hypothetical protein
MSKHIIHNEHSRLAANRVIDNIDITTRWVMEVKPEKKSRSLEQNDLYWKWVTEIGIEHGNFKDDQHEILMRKLMKPRIFEADGEVYEIYSTKKLSVKEMSEYLNAVSMWAGTQGILLSTNLEDQ